MFIIKTNWNDDPVPNTDIASFKKHFLLQLHTPNYEAPFKTKCHQCFQYLYQTSITYIYRTSNIHIGRPIHISDVRYLYLTTSGYLYLTSGYLYPTSGYLYLTSGYLYPTSDIYIGRLIYNTRFRLGQGLGLGLGPGYWTSDIDIGHPI